MVLRAFGDFSGKFFSGRIRPEIAVRMLGAHGEALFRLNSF
jgi:hypothetical protein